MGQYYNIIIRNKDQKTTHVFDRHIDGNYTMAKLTEHSWYLNPMVNAVAEKLSQISLKHQVLCISHLPSIAAIADYNYFISKNVIDERTRTNVKLLDETETIEEIARISSGEINEETIKYAMQLRNKRVS